ncbi:hypothetical protein EST38_g14236 [Candolleomyces aberdarensis]|uniref:Uncharacterized protein n=1 Tax=Candolleomyces aberdarensis TaxID=2316362 RepID=A0A4Q2CYT9_9AGAR|nr:hypothetical protein EST38_g14236 [Candolleomyces aberdarensis]
MQQSHSVPVPHYHHPSPSRPQTIATAGWLLPPPDAQSTPPPRQGNAHHGPISVPRPSFNKIPFGDNPFVGVLHTQTNGSGQFQQPPPPPVPPIPPACSPAPPVPSPQQYYYGPPQPQIIYLQAPAQHEKVPKKPPLNLIKLLSAPGDFHAWHIELQRVCIDHGLWPHIAPHPQNGATYIEGLWPSYMPQNPAEQSYWWKVDSVVSSMLVEHLSPSIHGLVPFSTAVSRVTSREIYNWILKHYGLNDYASFSALEFDLLRTNCTKTSVQEYTRNWLEKLSTIRTSSYPTDERGLLNGFLVGLPVNDPNYASLVAEIGLVNSLRSV